MSGLSDRSALTGIPALQITRIPRISAVTLHGRMMCPIDG
jgi:hypothetical protein